MKRKLKELMNRALRKEEGFTLVEIIVVIVIMAILAAIAVPSVLGYINDANDAKYLAEARSVYLAIQVEEAKWNATNTTGTGGDYVYAEKDAAGGGDTIYGNVVKRLGTEPELTACDADDHGGYDIEFTSADGATVTAKIDANDEITIDPEDEITIDTDDSEE